MCNSQNELARSFLRFEVENKLFDIRDSNGLYVWDIVRFEVEYSIIWNFSAFILPKRRVPKVSVSTVIKLIKLLFSRKQYKTLLITTSRNNLNGVYFDQNQHDAIELLSKEENFVLETYCDKNVIYDNSYPYYKVIRLFSIFSKTKYVPFDFSPIISLVKHRFPDSSITNESLNYTLLKFYNEQNFYRYFFNKHSIERVLITQNGIMKGLFATTKEFGIPTYEFQHGIVNEKHFAYSYPPDIDVESKSYQPTKMLRLSDYWFSDFYTPFECVTIGNNYFSNDISDVPKESKSLLVISTNAFGSALSDDVVSIASEICDWTIYYKLHPNEFNDYSYYSDKFKTCENIKIVKDEYSVNQLLSNCSTMFTQQSTAIYEALQGGRTVIVIDRGEYNEIKAEGVYHIYSANELVQILQIMTVPKKTIFFEKFKADIFLNTIGYAK